MVQKAFSERTENRKETTLMIFYKHLALIVERVCLIAIFGIYVFRPAVKAVMRKIENKRKVK